MKNLYILLFSLFSITAFSQSFTRHTIEQQSINPNDIHPTDIDGDGDLDLLMNDGIEATYWYESYGGSFFFQHRISRTGDGFQPWDTHSADFDEDGAMDVVVSGEKGIVAYKNKGEGDFWSSKSVSTYITRVHNLLIADIDGDSRLDIIAYGGSTGKELVWFEYQGTGTQGTESWNDFSEEHIVSNNVEIESMYAADLDKDGDVDIVFSYNDEINWLSNDGKGNFSTPITIPTEAFEIRSTSMKDIDNDGDMDILTTYFNDNLVVLYENNGTANFTQRTLSSTIPKSFIQSIIDIDSDGDRDILLTSGNTNINDLFWLENNGQNNFLAPQVFYEKESAVINASESFSVWVADLNGDSHLDLITNSSLETLAWHQNDGNGNFSESIIIKTNLDEPTSLIATDLNEDEFPDIVVGMVGTGRILWYPNDGQGDFSKPVEIAKERLITRIEVQCADIDNDGHIDVVAYFNTIEESKKTVWYKNDGKGNFSTKKPIAGGRSIGLHLTDFDSDGDLDLVSTFVGKVQWAENYGIGNFSGLKLLYEDFSFNYYWNASSTDLNLDGYMDILVPGQVTIEWLRNTGFESVQNFSIRPGFRLDRLSVVDVDDDGYEDVFTFSQVADKINYFQNKNGNLTLRNTISSVDVHPYTDIDLIEFRSWERSIVISDYSSNQIKFYHYYDLSTPYQTLYGVNGAAGVDGADMDNDGDVDLVTIGEKGNQLIWYENQRIVDKDKDGYRDGYDCDDNNPAINPQATEIPNNGIDDDCNGFDLITGSESAAICPMASVEIAALTDNSVTLRFAGSLDSTYLIRAEELVEFLGNEWDEEEFEGNQVNYMELEPCTEFAIQVASICGSSQTDFSEILIFKTTGPCPTDADNDGFLADIDCDDGDATIHPEAIEIPNNGIDEDCDGTDLVTLVDADNDGFTEDVDCDDTNAAINPAATEITNSGIDENCDGISFMIDEDNDGHNSSIDCDDNNPDINSSAIEIPNNGIDEDCDGIDLITVTCSPPTVSIDSTSNTWFFASWDAISPSYTIRLKEVLEEEWLEIETWTGTDLIFSTLQPCTFYEFQVASECETTKSVFSASSFIFTGGCSELYCHAYGLAYENWIEAIAVNGEGNTTGQDYGYGNYQHLAPSPLGEEATIQLIPGTNSTSIQKVFWSVWIDFNLNFEFEEEERVVFLEADNQMPINTSFTIPSGAFPGPLRLRIIMDVDIAQDACGTEGFREVEDYSLYIQQNLGVTAPSSTSDNHFFKLISSPSFTSENSIGTLSNQSIKSVMPLTNNSIQVAPNPIQDQFFIFIASERQADFKVQLVDIAGRALQQFQVTPNEWQPHQIDHLQSGVYLLQVDQNGLSETIKIIKQ